MAWQGGAGHGEAVEARPGEAGRGRAGHGEAVNNRKNEMQTNDEIIAELKKLESSRGRLDPVDVIDAARPATSPLHACFDWSDREAADKWRIAQARDLIRRIKIVVEVNSREVRTVAYVRDTSTAEGEAGYVSTMRITKTDMDATIADEIARILGNIERTVSILLAKGGAHNDATAAELNRAASIIISAERARSNARSA